MTKIKHPLDRRERYLIAQKKRKQLADERASRVRRKLERVRAKEQETQSELFGATAD